MLISTYISNVIYISFDEKTYSNDIVKNYLDVYNINKTHINRITKYRNIHYSSSNMSSLYEDNNNLYRIIINNSEFSTDSKEIANYSVNVVNSFKEIAYLQDMNIDTYYTKTLHYNKHQFYEYCYNIGQYDIEFSLIVGAIANREKIDITSADITNYLKSNNLSNDYYHNKKNKCIINYNILKRKVTKYLLKVNSKI